MKKGDLLIGCGLAAAIVAGNRLAPMFADEVWFGAIDAYAVVKYGAWLVALCLWIWLWARWQGRHPGQGVFDVLEGAIANCWHALFRPSGWILRRSGLRR